MRLRGHPKQTPDPNTLLSAGSNHPRHVPPTAPLYLPRNGRVGRPRPGRTVAAPPASPTPAPPDHPPPPKPPPHHGVYPWCLSWALERDHDIPSQCPCRVESDPPPATTTLKLIPLLALDAWNLKSSLLMPMPRRTQVQTRRANNARSPTSPRADAARTPPPSVPKSWSPVLGTRDTPNRNASRANGAAIKNPSWARTASLPPPCPFPVPHRHSGLPCSTSPEIDPHRLERPPV